MKQIITRLLSKIIRTNIGVEEKQGIITNAFQTVSSNGFVNGLLLVSLIIAYGIALQIAISGILRKLIGIFSIDSKRNRFFFLPHKVILRQMIFLTPSNLGYRTASEILSEMLEPTPEPRK